MPVKESKKKQGSSVTSKRLSASSLLPRSDSSSQALDQILEEPKTDTSAAAVKEVIADDDTSLFVPTKPNENPKSEHDQEVIEMRSVTPSPRNAETTTDTISKRQVDKDSITNGKLETNSPSVTAETGKQQIQTDTPPKKSQKPNKKELNPVIGENQVDNQKAELSTNTEEVKSKVAKNQSEVKNTISNESVPTPTKKSSQTTANNKELKFNTEIEKEKPNMKEERIGQKPTQENKPSVDENINASKETTTKKISVDERINTSKETTTKNLSIDENINAPKETPTKKLSINDNINASKETPTKKLSINDNINASKETPTKKLSVDENSNKSIKETPSKKQVKRIDSSQKRDKPSKENLTVVPSKDLTSGGDKEEKKTKNSTETLAVTPSESTETISKTSGTPSKKIDEVKANGMKPKEKSDLKRIGSAVVGDRKPPKSAGAGDSKAQALNVVKKNMLKKLVAKKGEEPKSDLKASQENKNESPAKTTQVHVTDKQDMEEKAGDENGKKTGNQLTIQQQAGKDFLSLDDSQGAGGISPLRRPSTISQISHFSTGEFSDRTAAGVAETGEHEGEIRRRFRSNESSIQEHVPILPLPAAIMILLINIFLPGLGTIFGGTVNICLAKEKDQKKNQGLVKVFCTNYWVGLSQLFTVTFLLVGWFWGIAWGIYAIQRALDQRDEEKRRRKQEITERALNALIGLENHHDNHGGGGGAILSLFQKAGPKRTSTVAV